ncbi:MAG: type II toxin-antitoxin system HicB family antitoxin [Chloroflexi bacterium]|nr:type II toxin-antitoxin system HicB family antitoxin [Chloroflexota bacterium]MCL5107354.1 type II toxin-antitoxin system HicB family antitoxin [Chloroflexota bacterium]
MRGQLRYTIILHPDPEGGYAVEVPTLPGCYTQGKTVAQCIERAQEAIVGHIACLREMGEPVPVETEHAQAIVIDVDSAA